MSHKKAHKILHAKICAQKPSKNYKNQNFKEQKCQNLAKSNQVKSN
ncbi:hypothetical protein HMPREF2086_00784 [Helicobacter macacae MIT 99-5501]|uniref:Uncharacterized protein n=1 Tax=Helicobacter macacae MIT 99-5501 TaxID=1357400 RepID=V8CAD0_9HELI|nr:hypothetical protein HMPREF2086_00784 [Helicobacter macacae MIT 99-5501]